MSIKDDLIKLISAHPLTAIQFQSDITAVRMGLIDGEEFKRRWSVSFAEAAEKYDQLAALLGSVLTEGKHLTELLAWYRDLAERQRNRG